MKFSAFIESLKESKHMSRKLGDGTKIPEHYHITEIGELRKRYIDCGGTQRIDNYVTMQLRCANDYDHRLTSDKLLKIIALYQEHVGESDDEILVEYQGETIGLYTIAYREGAYHLIPTQTTCLAMDACGIPPTKSDSCCGTNGCC